MLDVLKNHKYRGGKEALLFFICDVIGNRQISIRDAEILCSHALGRYYLSVEELVTYCQEFGWINVSEDTISVTSSISALLNDKIKLNEELIVSTVKQLFSHNIIEPNMFSYDAVRSCYLFKNELLPLSLSSLRNLLISQGFLTPLRGSLGTRFYISPEYDSLISFQCREKRKQLSLEDLKKQLENNELAGENAELFVLEYEKKRLGRPLCEKIKRISEIDVTAGYDIVSFNSAQSQKLDRFIEVKALSAMGFFWSSNEYKIAKLKGENFYLYLVELDKAVNSEYIPKVIQNPAVKIMEEDSWLVEAQSFFIKHV